MPKSHGMTPNRTPAEKFFAKGLQSKNIKFLHNVDLDGYEVDFYIPEYNIVIEIDGFHHLSSDKQQSDLRKERALSRRGITVFRLTNEQIWTDLSACLLTIETYIKNYTTLTDSSSINTAWKESLRSFQPKKSPNAPKKYSTIEEYFLDLDKE